MTTGAKFTTLDCLNQGHKAEDFPGLEEMAQQTYEIPFAELAPHLQRYIRERVCRMAAAEMLAALKRAIAFIGETQEYKTGHTGANSIVLSGNIAIDLAEGK